MLVLQFRIASNFLGISTHIYYTKTGKKAPNTSNFSQKEEKYVKPSITVGEKKLLPFLYELRRSEDKQHRTYSSSFLITDKSCQKAFAAI